MFKGPVSRHGHTLPGGCEADKVESNSSKKKIHVISAPNKPAFKSADDRKIQVKQKK